MIMAGFEANPPEIALTTEKERGSYIIATVQQVVGVRYELHPSVCARCPSSVYICQSSVCSPPAAALLSST